MNKKIVNQEEMISALELEALLNFNLKIKAQKKILKLMSEVIPSLIKNIKNICNT
jgi:hypothetical protein